MPLYPQCNYDRSCLLAYCCTQLNPPKCFGRATVGTFRTAYTFKYNSRFGGQTILARWLQRFAVCCKHSATKGKFSSMNHTSKISHILEICHEIRRRSLSLFWKFNRRTRKTIWLRSPKKTTRGPYFAIFTPEDRGLRRGTCLHARA